MGRIDAWTLKILGEHPATKLPCQPSFDFFWHGIQAVCMCGCVLHAGAHMFVPTLLCTHACRAQQLMYILFLYLSNLCLLENSLS